MPVPLAPALKAEYPDVQYITRYGGSDYGMVRYQNKEVHLNVRAVDPDFMRMFTFPIHAGNSKTPLGNLNDIVITEHCAKVLFDQEDPIGKSVEMKKATAGPLLLLQQ
ncbi:ABC transporter permease [Paraflavitalea speifideaquila]|uniref:ABC transporter permease n=1 Tax=Paraflavitalea speifideaquila TaxID=3076558 RepID=UPI0028EE0804|nr:ABC transporter permease [Paraflavitalea speifideiaquila]